MKSFEDFLNEAFEPKDEKRISDIITKADGDTAKAESLARSMANKITDPDKALRRAEAAEDQGVDFLAKIFYDRAAELGAKVPTSATAATSTEEAPEETESSTEKPAAKPRPTKTPAFKVGDFAKVSGKMIIDGNVELSDGKSWRPLEPGSEGRSISVTSASRGRWGDYSRGTAYIDGEYLKELDNQGLFYIKISKATGTWIQGYTYFANGIENPYYLVRFKTSVAIPNGPELDIFIANENEIGQMREKGRYLIGDENFVMKKSGEAYGEFESGIYVAKSLEYNLTVKKKSPVFYCVPSQDKSNGKAMKAEETLFIDLKDFEKLPETVTTAQMEVIAEWMSREIGATVEVESDNWRGPGFRIPYFSVKGYDEKGYLGAFQAGPFFTREQAEEEVERQKQKAKTTKLPYSVARLEVVTGNPGGYSSSRAYTVTYAQLMDYAKLVGIQTKMRKFFEEKRGQVTAKGFGF
jgi:hypothetical protein